MPKLKTNRSAAKRFRKTKSGAVVRNQAFRRHILTKKNRKRKRRLKQSSTLDSGDVKRIKRLVPYI